MSGFQLLTRPDSQPKAVKGQKKGYMTFVLHLAPSNLSGFNVCPNAGGCKIACLNKAGRGRFDPRVQAARIRKTRWYFAERDAFMAALYEDIAKAIRYAEKKGFIAAFRLNGTSDIPWHRMGVMDAFPAMQFYDYTKVAKRLTREQLPVNYHLTFSLAEDNENDARAVLAAAVMSRRCSATRQRVHGTWRVVSLARLLLMATKPICDFSIRPVPLSVCTPRGQRSMTTADLSAINRRIGR